MYSQLFELHANLLKAISHPRRLEIIHLLRDSELSVTDIYTMLDLPQANISQHLTILRDAQVLLVRRDGKQNYYSISDSRITQACDLLREKLIDDHQGSELASQLSLGMHQLLPLTLDPVCHMRVSPKTAGFHTSYHQKDYYFCASGCHTKFIKEPNNYV